MGLLDGIMGKKEENVQEGNEKESPAGKYSEECSLCGKPGTEKKWMGKYWHLKCIRSAKRAARGMI